MLGTCWDCFVASKLRAHHAISCETLLLCRKSPVPVPGWNCRFHPFFNGSMSPRLPHGSCKSPACHKHQRLGNAARGELCCRCFSHWFHGFHLDIWWGRGWNGDRMVICLMGRHWVILTFLCKWPMWFGWFEWYLHVSQREYRGLATFHATEDQHFQMFPVCWCINDVSMMYQMFR